MINGNLKANWFIGILLSIVGTLTYIGWAGNERRLNNLEDWRIQHERFVAVEVQSLVRQLATIEAEIKWIRRELEKKNQKK